MLPARPTFVTKVFSKPDAKLMCRAQGSGVFAISSAYRRRRRIAVSRRTLRMVHRNKRILVSSQRYGSRHPTHRGAGWHRFHRVAGRDTAVVLHSSRGRHLHRGDFLGPVGGRIVADVLVGLINADPTSFRRSQQQWQPRNTLSELLASQ